MWPWSYYFTRHTVGVEVGNNIIKAVQISSRQGNLSVSGMGSAPLPTETPTVEGLVAALTQCFGQFNYHGAAEVITTLPAEQLIYRTLTVPVMTETELETAMFYEAQDMLNQMLNQEMDHWVVRHCILEPLSNDQHQVRVLLVAAPRQLVLLLHEAFKRAKLKLKMIDFPYFGLWRSVRPQLAEIQENCALIHINEGTTLLMIVKNNGLHHLRLLPLGFNNIQQQGAASYVQQLDNTLEIYQQQMPVQKLILTGIEDISNFVADLDKIIGLPVERVQWPPMLANQLSENYIIATGLALQGYANEI